VVIPAWNEAAHIGRTLESLLGGAIDRCPELIVADGGSVDGTLDIVRSMGATIVTSQPGRASQMNAGTAAATGDHLLYLHADTLVPQGYDRQIKEVLADGGVAGGAFQLSIDAPNPSLRLIERCVNWRSRWLSLPYGDQGLFMRADTFRRLGGYADLPIMEDYELIRRLARLGRVQLAPASVVTSARRWLRQGVFCATWTNQACIIGYHLGVSPQRLAGWRDARCVNRGVKDWREHHADSDHGSGWADRQRSASAADE
jgi:uncharacterized protein